MEFRVPDGIEPIVGWKIWNNHVRRVDPDLLEQAGGALKSGLGNRPVVWPFRAPLIAECRSPFAWANFRHPQSPAPMRSCRCGIYALRQLSPVFDRPVFRADPKVPLVFGRVSLWGRVIVGTEGWRAEYSYPQHLYVLDGGFDERAADELAWHLDDYGVPVEIIGFGDLPGLLYDPNPMVPTPGGRGGGGHPRRPWMP